MRMNSNTKNIINKGIKSAKALANEYPGMRAGINLQIGKADITILIGLSDAGRKGGKR